jgi:Domain of unknown function (DUF4274)
LDYPEENAAMIRWLDGKNPEQRHFVAMHSNWDYAELTLDWLVTRPDCDLATAVELYWLAQPTEFIKYATKADLMKHASYFEWTHDFAGGIIRRYHEGFYTRSAIAFSKHYAVDWLLDEIEKNLQGNQLAWQTPEPYRQRRYASQLEDTVIGVLERRASTTLRVAGIAFLTRRGQS